MDYLYEPRSGKDALRRVCSPQRVIRDDSFHTEISFKRDFILTKKFNKRGKCRS